MKRGPNLLTEPTDQNKKICTTEHMFRNALLLSQNPIPPKQIKMPVYSPRLNQIKIPVNSLRSNQTLEASCQIIRNLFHKKLGIDPTNDDMTLIKRSNSQTEGATLMYIRDIKIPRECNRIFQTFLKRVIDKDALVSFTSSLMYEKLKIPDLENLIKSSEECKRIHTESNFNLKLLNNQFTYDDVKHLIISDRLKDLKIKYMGPVGITGYANAVKSYLYSLFIHGAQLTFQMIQKHYTIGDNPSDKDKVLYACMNRDIDYDVVIIHSIPDAWKNHIEKERLKNPNVFIIGLTVWEANRIHPGWIHPMNMANMVMTACEWNKSVFEIDVKTPVCTIHTPVDTLVEPDPTFSIPDTEPDDFVFYTINEWTNRKGIEDVIRVFLDVFNTNDRVVLYLKCSTFKEELAKKFIEDERKKHQNPPRIILDSRELSDNQISSIHKRGNVYVSLTRGEATGLGAVEASLNGNPVIMSAYGGQQSYLKSAFFVTCSEETPSMCTLLQDGHSHCKPDICHRYPWYTPQAKWGKPNLQDAQRLLHFVFSNYQECKSTALLSKRYIEQNLNSKIIGERMGNMILEAKRNKLP